MKTIRFNTMMLTGVSLLCLATPALAQTAAAPAATTPPAAQSSVKKDDTTVVVVTGSRVLKNGNASPTPVTVLSVDTLSAQKPGPIAEVIATLPTFSGSRVASGNPGNGTTNAAANVLVLRNMGLYRTLILFDGQRVPPSTYDEQTDVDMIPQMLLQRVDTVTGGTSAVYGSDAVAGVVNFITDTRFNGLKLDLEGGVSNYGDEHKVMAGIAWGTKVLNDRGHVELSYQYNNDPGILSRADRQFGRDVWTMQGSVPGSTYAAGTVQNPYELVENTRIDTTTFGGLINKVTGGPASLTNEMFTSSGGLTPFVNGTPTGNATYQSGGSGGYYNGSLAQALRTNQVFARFDYDFSDSVQGFIEGSYTANHTLNEGQYNAISKATFSGTNPYLPAADQFAGTFTLSELMQNMPRIDTDTNQNQHFILAGLKGEFDNYHWELSATSSDSKSETTNDNNINNSRLYAALDAVSSGGQIVCRASLTNSAFANCVPLDVFGGNAATPAAMAYITQATQFTVDNGLDTLSGDIAGSPFSDWAGPVTLDLSGEARRERYSVVSDAQPSQLASCTGIKYNCTATTPLYADGTLANRSPVSEDVWETALEAEVPLLKDLPLAEDVSFNGAIRYAHYSVSGGATTWKGGLVWKIDDQWKLRGTRSRDFRAPTLYDLYQPLSVNSTTPFTDNLTGQTPTVPVYTQGNPNLKPEVGNTTTAGFVYTPAWLPRFSFSADAYYIDVTNAIASESGYSPAIQNVCDASGGTSPYCALEARPDGYSNTSAANTVTAWYSESVNVAEQKTYGVDFEANYAASVADHPLTLRGLLTWQPHILIITPGLQTVDQAGSGLNANNLFPAPRIRATLYANYKIGAFNIGLDERYRSSLSFVNDPTIHVVNGPIKPLAYTDANLVYSFESSDWGHSELFLNIQNLFNTAPPPIAGVQANANVGTFGGFATGQDDPIGRYFMMGIRIRK